MMSNGPHIHTCRVSPENNNARKSFVARTRTSLPRMLSKDCDHVDLIGKQECLKALKDFNKETARYGSLATMLGSATDSKQLREELHRSRKKSYELAVQNKIKLLPHVKGSAKSSGKHDLQEFEKLWILFASCLEILESQVCRTLTLQETFPLHPGPVVFINTGATDAPTPTHKNACGSSSVQPLELSPEDKARLEAEEIKMLERDIGDIHTMLLEVQEVVDINPWNLTAELDTTKLEYNKSIHYDSEAGSSEVEVTPDFEASRRKRRKCVIILSIFLSCIVVFSIVLGISLGLLT